jgi:hypothetical protein
MDPTRFARRAIARAARMATLAVACTASAPVLAKDTPAPPEPPPPAWTPELLKTLGMQPAGTAIDPEGYEQLVVSLYLPGNSPTNVVLDKCPRQAFLGFDLGKLLKPDRLTSVGVNVDSPLVPQVDLHPIRVESRKKGFFGHDCDISVDVMRYRSPLYYVRKNDGKSFTVATSVATTKSAGDALGTAMNKLLKALTGVAGVPAAVAQPILGAVDKAIVGATLTDKQKFILHFPIGDDAVVEPMSWTIPGAMLGRNGEDKGDIVVAAQVVPVPPLVAAPAQGVAWTAGRVLGSAFQLPPLPDVPSNDTLGGYLSSRFHAEELAYANANVAEAANTACVALASRIDSTGLSDRDAALALWAMTRQRIDLGKAKVGDVDAMACLASRWPMLLLAGVPKGDPPPPDAAYPTVAQMKTVTDVDEALLTFFKTAANWKERKSAAEQLFHYPLAVSDAAAALLHDTTGVENTNGWLEVIDKDKPLLAPFGCYAYFDKTATHPFATARARSFMLAIGQVAATDPATPPREVAVMLDFAATSGGKDSRVEALTVLTALTDEAKAAMYERLGSTTTCKSGYQPRLLFGH